MEHYPIRNQIKCFPLHIIHNLKDKLLHKTKNSSAQTQTKKKWITLTNHSPLVCKVTNLFQYTSLNIAFKVANILHSNLNSKSPHDIKKTSGIYKLNAKHVTVCI